jgi:hypothetical protein
VETPRKFITAKLSIRKPGSSSVLIICVLHIISTDEDPGLRIESFAVINLRGVSTNKSIIFTGLLLILVRIIFCEEEKSYNMRVSQTFLGKLGNRFCNGNTGIKPKRLWERREHVSLLNKGTY